MFEQDFENLFRNVFFGVKDVAEADEEGIGKFTLGDNIFHTLDAIITVRKYDKALLNKHYAPKRNRMCAQRNCIVTAFGPEMAEKLGFAS